MDICILALYISFPQSVRVICILTLYTSSPLYEKFTFLHCTWSLLCMVHLHSCRAHQLLPKGSFEFLHCTPALLCRGQLHPCFVHQSVFLCITWSQEKCVMKQEQQCWGWKKSYLAHTYSHYVTICHWTVLLTHYYVIHTFIHDHTVILCYHWIILLVDL